ncbi:hypothetical protein H310_00457 [Aphanomyces invadans]|uniref:Uncharacterized protein n=1 Tax=Aphanomyces invadans TaxID=157072 RepID=A0A024UU71_9STRA|nr:hypothetical protein H310_00457 [Aphanomyces invadans]ETW10071.1 hypothetical protein H310_00457 [Aphanomyces invadans]|eukprot:XP_008861482.1 hypothetical protein H310_00457 [Aphanomyces invadans]
MPPAAREAIDDFVAFVTKRVEMRHSEGLALLVKAYAAGEATALCNDLVDEFVNEASNVVIYAKNRPSTSPAPFPSSSPPKKCPHCDATPASPTADVVRAVLATTTPDRVDFNENLHGFLRDHGQAMWERYFSLPDRESPRSTARLRAAIQAFGLLVHELYVLEGVDGFRFLAHYPHPSWPILSEHSLLPYNFQGKNFLR